MKHIKLFVFLAVVLLLPCLCMARMNSYVAGVSTSTCTYTSKNAQTGTGADLSYTAEASRNRAISFTANGTYSPRRITVSLKKTNSPTVTMEFLIRQDAGESTSITSPGTAIISLSATLSASTLTTSYADYDIDITELETASLTNGNVYWMQIYGGNSATNYVQWQYSASGSEEYDYTTAPPTTWSEGDTSVTGNFTIWSCE